MQNTLKHCNIKRGNGTENQKFHLEQVKNNRKRPSYY